MISDRKVTNMKKALKNNKGWTLVELIIVIAIMALLVAIVTPNLLQYVYKAQKVRDMEMARVLGTALERCISIDPDVNTEWNIISDKNGVKGADGITQSHVEYTVTDYATGKKYKITNVFEFTLTKEGEIQPDPNHLDWHCEEHYRNGILRNARKQVTKPGDDILWDSFTDEIATIEINIMYRRYSIKQFKISKNLSNGRVEVWVCPVAPGTDGEGKGNGWVYYRLYPDPDPRYMSNQAPVGTNANGGGKAPTTF
jgi:prepilin-type N-terminal cleavage/methylation domain-containing protein